MSEKPSRTGTWYRSESPARANRTERVLPGASLMLLWSWLFHPQEGHVRHHENGDHDEYTNANRRPVSQPRKRHERLLVVNGQRLHVLPRSKDDVEDVEHAQGIERAEYQGNQYGRTQQRQGDPDKLLHRVGPIHGGRFVDVGRDHLQPG